MKICKGCGLAKPIEDYHRSARASDGRATKCRQCESQRHKAHYARHCESVKAKVRAYQAGKGRALANGSKSTYKTRNPKKVRAHQLVRNALRRGDLVRQPCETCGSVDHVVAHHDDYDQPLAIRWLCEDHHKEWHKIHGEAANPS